MMTENTITVEQNEMYSKFFQFLKTEIQNGVLKSKLKKIGSSELTMYSDFHDGNKTYEVELTLQYPDTINERYILNFISGIKEGFLIENKKRFDVYSFNEKNMTKEKLHFENEERFLQFGKYLDKFVQLLNLKEEKHSQEE